MIDQRFLVSKVSLAALVSVAAMIAFNVYAFSQQPGIPSQLLTASVPMVELA